MSPTMTFSQRVYQLFFGVDISGNSSSLVDILSNVEQLQHLHKGARQTNLNIAMEMESDEAWSTRHEFIFTESPLPDFKIEKGIIEITIGETDSFKKLINLNWRLQFTDKVMATKYFGELKQLFADVATNKCFEQEKKVGHIAQFSNRDQFDTGIRNITFILGKSPLTSKYEINLIFGSKYMNE